MARSRPQQSLADYVAIAISPALIMLLVGSLVFFLQQITYDGNYVERVRWMLFWFVFATVLISRIGIEQGRSHAAMYGGAMAIACALFAQRFLNDYFIGVVILLGIIWWCVDKLTWDCTFIDDKEDQSGAGLLQQSGLETPPETEQPEEQPIETEQQRRRRLRREELLGADSPSNTSEPDPPEEENVPKSTRKHAPGVWVIYFSLAALPLFGVGQAFLPSDDSAARALGFRFLWVYVASALGLLLTTSFLGLRRYLRQRKLTMPPRITAVWLTMGATVLAAILLLTLLIPRPDAETSVTALLDQFADKQAASEHALAANDSGEGEGRRAGEHKLDEGEPGSEQKEGGKKTDAEGEGNKSGESEQQGKGESNEQSEGDEGKNSDRGKDDPGDGDKQENADDPQENEGKKEGEVQAAKNEQQDGEQQEDRKEPDSSPSSSSSTPPPSSPALSTIAEWAKWLIYIVCGVLIALALYKNRHNLIDGAREFFRSIANFWRNLFAGKDKKKKTGSNSAEEAISLGKPARSFADYPNPFLTGEAHRMRPDALVIYTEEAFRAFGYEHGIKSDEVFTAIEFGHQVEAQHPQMKAGIQFLTNMYSRILYSANPPHTFEIKPLEQLWAEMSRV